MMTNIFKKTGLLTLLLSVFSLGIVGCASEEEKGMSDEQRQEEEYFGLEDEISEQEEAQMQQQQEDEFSLEDEFADSEEIGQQQHAELEQQTAQEKPWADQQISLNKVKEIQDSLNNKGFSAGSVDGLIGPETQSALKNFQEANNLTASGELDQETIDALGLDINLKQAQEESGQSQMAE